MSLDKLRAAALGAVLAVIFLVASCADTGSDTVLPDNIPPTVNIVNIPPDSSHFTSNPTIYWFGTDVDGYIVGYEYLVVRQDTLLARGVNVALASELKSHAAVSVNVWNRVNVNEVGKNPTQQQVRLFAGAEPSDTVPQYFFVRAVDDDSARSDIQYRIYSRNNNPPDTEIDLVGTEPVYWDLPDTTKNYKGIEIRWEGTDKLDYPLDVDDPDFEFFFQVFGPYEDGEIDTSDLPGSVDTLNLGKLVLTGVDTATNSVWLTQESMKIYNLWRNAPPVVETRDNWFVAKVTARDDAFVSDTLPAYAAFRAIYPKFENLLVGLNLTATTTTSPGDVNGKSNVAGLDTLNAFIQEVFTEAGYGPLEMLPTGLPKKEYFGSYKNVVVFNDGEFSTTSKLTKGHLEVLAGYMDLGGNVWVWSPNPFGVLTAAGTGPQLVYFGGVTRAEKVPINYFDIEAQYRASWKNSWTSLADAQRRNKEFLPPANDQFMRGLAIYGKGFNDFEIATEKGWLYFLPPLVDTHNDTIPPYEYNGAPNASYLVRDIYSEPLYLIDSYYGDFVADSIKPYIETLQGKVVAMRYDAGSFKSAVFAFSMWMMHKEDAVEIVQKMMTWFKK